MAPWLAFSTSTQSTPVFIPYTVEKLKWWEWQHKPIPSILDEFNSMIMQANITLSRNLLSGHVLKAMSHQAKYLNFANDVWTFLRKPHHHTKPNQLMFSQMLTLYRLALHHIVQQASDKDSTVRQGAIYQRSKLITKQAVDLASEWIFEYRTDPHSLQRRLSILNIQCPVILNQIIRILALRENAYCWLHRPWMLSTIQFYVRKAVELGIGVDQTLRELLVTLVTKMDTLDEVKFVVDDIIIPTIGKENFLLFNVFFQNRITSKIMTINQSEGNQSDAQLYAFRLLYLCHQQNRTSQWS